MDLELKILWDGLAPGIAEHRLSIEAFGPALNALLAAYRRIASNMIRNAVDYAQAGRFRYEASNLDIEIVGIEEGSVGMSAACTMRTAPGQQVPLFIEEIRRNAAKELLDAVEEESKGTLRNSSVRKYLTMLPGGLTHQYYRLSDADNIIREFTVGEMTLPEEELIELPYLCEFSGDVIGVGFEPGKTEVRVKSESGQTMTFQASPAQVDLAIKLRGVRVRGAAVVSKYTRLLRMETEESPQFVVTPELEEKFIFQKWDSLLQRLAQ